MVILFSGGALARENSGEADPERKKLVYVMEIRNDIDPRMNRRTDLALQEAKDLNVDLVIIDMNTYGGAVYDANDIRSNILNFEKPVYVFVNDNAASAGALISIACDSIYMAPGASIGAATVVTADGQAAPDKYQSYMRSIMRSTAEANGRDPQIAEAMVDENIEIDSITRKGEVITFSTSEAIKYGFCEGEVHSIEELISLTGLEEYEIVNQELSAAENIIAFFINPIVSGILILIILGGLYFELQTPGVGFPLMASVIALALYLTPYYLNGLAANWEIIVFFLGLGLLALELLVIPGFGIAGVSGIIMSVGALVLMMVNNDIFDFTFVAAGELFNAVVTTLVGLTGAVIVMFIGGVRLTNSRFFKRVALQGTMSREEGYTSSFRTETLVGKTGVSYTVLRPSGKVMIDGEIYDAFTRGDYIGQHKEVVVIEDTGASLRVKQVEKENEEPAK